MRSEFHSDQGPHSHTIAHKLEVMLRKMGRKPAYSWGKVMRRPGEYWSAHSEPLAMRVSFPRERFVRRLAIFTLLVTLVTVLTMTLFIVVIPQVRRSHAVLTRNDLSGGAGSVPKQSETSKVSVRDLSDSALVSELATNDIDEIYALELIGRARARKIPDLDTVILPQLAHESYAVRLETIKIVVASRKIEHAQQIVGFLLDPDPLVRANVAQGLAILGDPASAIALRSRFYLEQSPEVRRAITGAIQTLER